MFDEIREILAGSNKPLRIPNAQQKNANTWYIRAVWHRVGGVWRTNKQAEVAATLDISLSTLKRYMTVEDSCPYLVQFGLESLAGMSEAGVLYSIEDSRLCRDLIPFGAALTSPIHTYIVLTRTELNQLDELAKANGYSLGKVSIPTFPES